MSKSIEQRLYEAYRAGRGIRLSADELDALIRYDDAIQSRINNIARQDAGGDPLDDQGGMFPGNLPTWRELGKRMNG